MTLTAGSLFSGIGGLDLAAEWAGIEIAWQCEINEFCRKVLKKHWPGVKQYDDITKLGGTKIQSVDIIFGGFPCQPYSIAGKRKGDEDDRALWKEMFRIIDEIRPRWIVGENVANFANMGLDNALFDLESIGYKGQSFIIPAVAVGAPHRRDRIFIVAHSCGIGRMEHKGQQETIQQPQERYVQRSETKESCLPESFHGIENAADANSKHLQRGGEKQIQREQELQGIPYYGSVEEWGKRSAVYQPKLCGSFNGIPDQVDRLKSLGNAVVPQQAYPIFQAIADIEKGAIA